MSTLLKQIQTQVGRKIKNQIEAIMSANKPSLPSNYVVPKVWVEPKIEGKWGAINKPTAGARFEAKLPRGDHPLQLHSLGTPNGQKVTIMLEELGVEYDAWKVNIGKGEQFSSGFVEANPNSKIPALLDYSENSAVPVRVFETGSILLYLAEKYDKFVPKDSRAKAECMNWLFWNIGTAPFIGGGFGHFYHYAPVNIEYAINRFSMETKRILDVLDKHLAVNAYMAGEEYTIADMAIFPWVKCLDWGYNAAEFLQFNEYENVIRWIENIEERPAVKRGLKVNGWGENDLPERHSKADFDELDSSQ
uniref:Glutathione S-transferase n=2 Tax=Sar TaxID=2698737 RepID=A0A7S3PBB9_9STRA|mmetsp:Transcript_18770/g.22903  ORF Transcript_18770/g.22903 Transcript_18770/m.22903 type:complete len:305 (+) Transcript_18770:204-1118(+)